MSSPLGLQRLAETAANARRMAFPRQLPDTSTYRIFAAPRAITFSAIVTIRLTLPFFNVHYLSLLIPKEPSGDAFMKISQRFLVCVVAMLLVAVFATSSFGQQADPEARAGVAAGAAGYARVQPRAIDPSQPIQLSISSSMVFDAVTGELIDGASGLGASNNSSRSVGSPSGARGGSENSNNARRTPLGGTIDGLDTLATFDGAFAAQAGPSLGNVFRF